MFITFEGPEGAGKSTALRQVQERLEQLGRPTVATREPGAGSIGKQIREILLHGEELPYETELFLFLADRANHMATIIEPALTAGKWVLCDRHADSTYVYQSVVRGLEAEFVKKANRFATQGRIPDRTFLFDLSAEVGLGRLTSRDRLDAQPLEFHQRVRQGFLDLAAAEPDRFRIIDANQSPEAVVEAVLVHLV